MNEAAANAWITTSTGRRFRVLDPRPEDVCIEDIAHALSLQCRFTGHIREFYSVAQHSVYVSLMCPPEVALWGLLHDASEAYIGDMSAPLKHTPEMKRFRDTELLVSNAIMNRFGLSRCEPPSVKYADRRMLLTEARDLGMNVDGWDPEVEPFDSQIVAWSPSFAEARFLQRFQHLTSSFPNPVLALCQADGYVDQEVNVRAGA